MIIWMVMLYLVVQKFADEVDLSPDAASNNEMGYIFEDLIHRFSEMSNETAGEHFTPREVIRLMVNILFCDDNDLLSGTNVVKTVYDPACGTGGMLSVSEEYSTIPIHRIEFRALLAYTPFPACQQVG